MKPSKENEPVGILHGEGRPDVYRMFLWHQIFETPFDIHGGGLDLKFLIMIMRLHKVAVFKIKSDLKSYAKYWMHNGEL